MKRPVFTAILAAGLSLFCCVCAQALTSGEQAEAFHARGLAAEKRGDVHAAMNCYLLALRINSGHAAALASLSELEKKLPQEVRLDAQRPMIVKVGYGNYQVNRYDGDRNAKVLLNGQPCKSYIFAHADSTVTFKVPPGTWRFTATGIGQTKYMDKERSWMYQVMVGNTVLFQSQRLDTCPDSQVAIDVPLPRGATTITLATRSMGPNFRDHSIWAEPKLVRMITSVASSPPGPVVSVNPNQTGPAPGNTSATLSPETKAKLAELEAWFKKACASGPASQLRKLYDQYDALLVSLATSLADKPAEAAAVNAVRYRLAATLPTAPPVAK